jgi:small subunit ribosomal protein S2
MKGVPDAIFVLDLRKEQLAIREARRLGLPVVALVDTNCDPDDADYVIPGNDDAIRSCSLIVRVIANAIEAGKSKVTAEEMAMSVAAASAAEVEPAAAEVEPAADEEPAQADQAPQGESHADQAPADQVPEEVPAE